MNTAKRRLQAILCADAVGYSRLMGEDDAHALSTLNASRAVFRDSVKTHGGRVVDTAGDSVLAVFDSVIEAVDAARMIQQTLADNHALVPLTQRMLFRIGVNLGDIIEQADGTIYGDGVNVAARIQSLAEPGGITVSSSVYEFIQGRTSVPVRDLGEHAAKNIARPVRVYALGPVTQEIAATAAIQSKDVAAASVLPSVAVLPFMTMGGDPLDEVFADGISEDIITELSRFRELAVTARNSSFAYKGRAVKAQDVGRELNVRYILEGSVRKAADRVRVTAQLIDAGSGNHLWAERFDRRLEDVFAVQDELTSKIVSVLVKKVTDSERRRGRADARTENLAAYELLLRGRELWFRFTREDNLAARVLYEQALALDPHYARAYASLAWTYMTAYNEFWADDPQTALDLALDFAQKGIVVDAASHSNWIALGQVLYYRKNLPRAVEAYQTAIELNRSDADGYAFLSQVLSLHGEPQQAIDLLDHAFALNPHLGQWPQSLYVVAYFNARRYEAALATISKLIEPPVSIQRWIAPTYAYLGRLHEAQAAVTKYRVAYPQFNLAEHLARIPFTHAADREHYAAGLRLAGLV
jgi:adenylate cyclase